MQRVLNLATRRVFGDLFCIKKWEATDDLQDWHPTLEMFFITISNLSPAQVTSENLRRYLACMGEILSFSYPVRESNGSFSITVRASIRFRQRLVFTVNAENELGYVNRIYFKFHNFPCNFCEYCNLIGHKMSNCLQAELTQHQAEVNQAHADVFLLAMQQEAVLQQEQMQPVMVQDNMELSEDSLSDSSVEQAATEVTCNDYISQLEENKENQSELRQLASNSEANNEEQVVPSSRVYGHIVVGPRPDAYMWKVIQKRDKPGNPFTSASASWDEGSSSQQHNINMNIAYFQNWSLMQSFFHWDNPLPVPKRPRVDELELTLAPPSSRQLVIKEVEESGNGNQLLKYPHQWFHGDSSNGHTQDRNNDE